jgi:hypothetical protein
VQAPDAAHRLAGLGVEDIDPGAVGEVKAVRPRIGEQVIPKAVAADLPAVKNALGLLRGKHRRTGKKAAHKGSGN